MPRRRLSRALRRAACASLLLLTALSSTGCLLSTREVEKPVLVNRRAPEELARACPRQPARPAAFFDDNEFLAWVGRALFAGAACRAQSDQQGEWMANPPS